MKPHNMDEEDIEDIRYVLNNEPLEDWEEEEDTDVRRISPVQFIRDRELGICETLKRVAINRVYINNIYIFIIDLIM